MGYSFCGSSPSIDSPESEASMAQESAASGDTTCDVARAKLQHAGEVLAKLGNWYTWTGIGLVGVSGIAIGVAPETAPYAAEGALDGYALIQIGNYLSFAGMALQGYAAGSTKGEMFNMGLYGFADWLSGIIAEHYVPGFPAGEREEVQEILSELPDDYYQVNNACDVHP